jgi:hypothetical protein
MRCVTRRLRSRVLGLAVATLAVLVATATATAASDSFTLRVTPAGTAAAVAVTPVKADLGKASTWTGGFVDANLITDLPCANYRPRYSDLIVTGVATAQFIGHGLYVRSQSKILQTKQMVKLHWQRSIRSPQWFACSVQTYKKMGGSTHFVSLRRLTVPQFAPYSSAFRVVTDVTTGSGKVRVALDTLEIARGRTEITLSASAPLAQAKGLLPSEIALGKVLISRARV